MTARPLLVMLPIAAVIAALALHQGAGHDYIQLHASASLLASGRNPYGVPEQIQAQNALQPLVAPRESPQPSYDQRLGFLPYFYPPWLALACIPLTSLPYPFAKALWVVLGSLAVAASATIITNAHPKFTIILAPLLALMFMPAYCALALGQTSPFVLLALAASWRLLDKNQPWPAGMVLACLTIKPQLTIIALPAALLWSARQGRWTVLAGFAASLALIGLACLWLCPSWPQEFLLATRYTPVPTATDPSVGVTWLSVLRTLGLSGLPLALAFVALALPASALALQAAWDRARPPSEPLALGVLAAFFVSPYSLGYDLAVLLFPLAFLLPRLSNRGRLSTLALALIFPHWHLLAIIRGLPQVTLFWLPAALAAAWLVSIGQTKKPCPPHNEMDKATNKFSKVRVTTARLSPAAHPESTLSECT